MVRAAADRRRKGEAVTSDFRTSTVKFAAAGLAPERSRLENGVVLLAKRTTSTPAVAINLAIRCGSIADPPGVPGLAWLLSREIDGGTARHRAAEIAEEVDSRGVTLTLAVTRHTSSVLCTVLAE